MLGGCYCINIHTTFSGQFFLKRSPNTPTDSWQALPSSLQHTLIQVKHNLGSAAKSSSIINYLLQTFVVTYIYFLSSLQKYSHCSRHMYDLYTCQKVFAIKEITKAFGPKTSQSQKYRNIDLLSYTQPLVLFHQAIDSDYFQSLHNHQLGKCPCGSRPKFWTASKRYFSCFYFYDVISKIAKTGICCLWTELFAYCLQCFCNYYTSIFLKLQGLNCTYQSEIKNSKHFDQHSLQRSKTTLRIKDLFPNLLKIRQIEFWNTAVK